MAILYILAKGRGACGPQKAILHFLAKGRGACGPQTAILHILAKGRVTVAILHLLAKGRVTMIDGPHHMIDHMIDGPHHIIDGKWLLTAQPDFCEQIRGCH